ncbi:MAG: nucleotidyltransferase domain-containing protein [Candidatus Asgardarchaeum sp.]
MLLVYKDEIIKQIVQDYVNTDENLLAVILYGSVARGDFKPDSDIDLLLITKNVKKTRKLFSDFREEVFTKTNVIISAVYVTPEMYNDPKNPLMRRIKAEGMVLWKK